jgi:DNA-binding LacI/PurR family transcriptional regulator
VRERFEGYQDALRDAGIPFQDDLVEGEGFEIETGHQAVRALLEREAAFTAIFAPNDTVALGAMRALDEAGLRIPEDVAIIGCGNLDVGSWTKPSLSTVDQSPMEIGRAALQLLMNRPRLADPKSWTVGSTIVGTRVVGRQSTLRPSDRAENLPPFPIPRHTNKQTKIKSPPNNHKP